MSSRALSLATVMFLIGCFAVTPLQAENLEAGKSPSQIFAGTCNACHKSPRGLLKTVSAGSLPSFLREHYTTSSDMAKLLSGFLIANGATDTRVVGTKQAKDTKQDPKQDAKPVGPSEQLDRFGHRLRPASPSQEAAKPDTAKPAVDGQAPVQAAIERGPDGHLAKQKLGKRGRPGSEEPPKTDAAKPDLAKGEPAKGEPTKEDAPKTEAAKTEAAKDEGSKPEASKPSAETKTEAKSEAKTEVPKETGRGETPILRADPVPPVTPAPLASQPTSVAVSSGTPEPAAPSAPVQSRPPSATPPAVTAAAPPAIAPAGPPAPPISQ